jgi:hypothetical protein
MRQRHYKREVRAARWYTIGDLETLPVRADRTHRPVGTWLSLVEHSLGVRGVGSSNLPVPTKFQPSAFSQSRSLAKRARDFACLGSAAPHSHSEHASGWLSPRRVGCAVPMSNQLRVCEAQHSFGSRYPNGGGTFSAGYAFPNVSPRNSLSSMRCRRLIIPGVSSL